MGNNDLMYIVKQFLDIQFSVLFLIVNIWVISIAKLKRCIFKFLFKKLQIFKIVWIFLILCVFENVGCVTYELENTK